MKTGEPIVLYVLAAVFTCIFDRKFWIQRGDFRLWLLERPVFIVGWLGEYEFVAVEGEYKKTHSG
jgi:hypothetical protein